MMTQNLESLGASIEEIINKVENFVLTGDRVKILINANIRND